MLYHGNCIAHHPDRVKQMPLTPTGTPCICRPNKVIWAHILKAHVNHLLDQFTCCLLVCSSLFIRIGPTTCSYMHVKEWGFYTDMVNYSECTHLGSSCVNKKEFRSHNTFDVACSIMDIVQPIIQMEGNKYHPLLVALRARHHVGKIRSFGHTFWRPMYTIV